MRAARMIVAAGALLGLMTPGAADAQELDRVVQNWLRCYIVDGWVAFDGTRLANIGPFNNRARRGAGQEALSVRNENGQCVLTYERPGNEDQLTIEVAASGDRILLRRTPRGGSAVLPVEFKQVANEKITLTLGSGTGQQVFRTRNLWQLLIAQPKECQQHLLPLLEMLRPNWNLADTAARVEERLLQQATGDGRRVVLAGPRLVAQLGDESFAKREAADRALRTGNAGAIAYLRQLDVNHLDTEQQLRVGRILEAMAVQNGDDSVEQVAATLAADPALWLALLARPDPSTRRTAARELARLLGQSIPSIRPPIPTARRPSGNSYGRGSPRRRSRSFAAVQVALPSPEFVPTSGRASSAHRVRMTGRR